MLVCVCLHNKFMLSLSVSLSLSLSHCLSVSLSLSLSLSVHARGCTQAWREKAILIKQIYSSTNNSHLQVVTVRRAEVLVRRELATRAVVEVSSAASAAEHVQERVPEVTPQQEVEDEVGGGAEHHQSVRDYRHHDVSLRVEEFDTRESHEKEDAGSQHARAVPHTHPDHKGRQLLSCRDVRLGAGGGGRGDGGQCAGAFTDVSESEDQSSVDDEDAGEGEEEEEEDDDVQGEHDAEQRQRPHLLFAHAALRAEAEDEVQDKGQDESQTHSQNDGRSLQGETHTAHSPCQEGPVDGEASLHADVHNGVREAPVSQVLKGEEQADGHLVGDVSQVEETEQQNGGEEDQIVQRQQRHLFG